MVTKEQLEKEVAELTAQRAKCWEMMLRYDGALQAVEALVKLCDTDGEPSSE